MPAPLRYPRDAESVMLAATLSLVLRLFRVSDQEVALMQGNMQ